MTNYVYYSPCVYEDIPKENIVFEPIIGSSQEIVIDTRADETLYHGTRGPGKTATEINYPRQFIGIGYGAHLKILMIDKHYKNFADIIAQAKKFFLPYGDCKFLGGTSEVKFVWDTGEEFLLRHMKDPKDYLNIHGMEYPIILWNELTKHPTSELYDLVASTNRSSFVPEIHTPKLKDGTYNTPDKKPLPPIPLKIIATTNSSGPGRLWVKRRFIDPAPSGTLIKTVVKDVFNPRTQKKQDVTRTRMAVFGSFMENTFLPVSYIADLMEKTKHNKHLHDSWIKGLWDTSSGGAFDDLWDRDIHIKPRFKIPSNWYLKRCFDWGSSTPFAVVWIAEANGENAIMEDGSIFCPAKGSFVVFQEWFGGEDIAFNKGLGLSPREICLGVKKKDKKYDGILGMEANMLRDGYISGKIHPGAADNQIGNIISTDVETIKKKMSDCGVHWTPSDKSSGSRVNGLSILRQMLKCSIEGEGKGIYFMQNCTNCTDSIPFLPLDEDNPEDIEDGCIDHLYDALRYGATESSNRTAKNIEYQPVH